MSHTCHWPNCKRKVAPRLWGCGEHWHALPAYLRAKIWAAYVPGQEITKTPSVEYLAAAHEVQAWILATFGAEPDRHDPGRWERLVRWVRERDAARKARREAEEDAP